MIHRLSASLPYGVEQVFDLAADIERYPEFLKGWISVRVLERRGEHCAVEQQIGLGPIQLRFVSQATLKRPERIEVTSSEPPFRRFLLSWGIEPSPSGSRVCIAVDLEMRSLLLQRAVSAVMPLAVEDIIASFTVRARALYGAPS